MPREWEKVLVVDLEMTCWEGETAPPGEISEIIEVGVCVWNSITGEISPGRSWYVKPVRSTVSEFCTNLTGITPRRVFRGGETLEKVCARLVEKYGSKNKAWAAFGDDAEFFAEQCNIYGVQYPWNYNYIDVSGLYSLKTGKRRGLAAVMTDLGLEFEGRPHCGADDAYNTARVLRKLIKGE